MHAPDEMMQYRLSLNIDKRQVVYTIYHNEIKDFKRLQGYGIYPPSGLKANSVAGSINSKDFCKTRRQSEMPKI